MLGLQAGLGLLSYLLRWAVLFILSTFYKVKGREVCEIIAQTLNGLMCLNSITQPAVVTAFPAKGAVNRQLTCSG